MHLDLDELLARTITAKKKKKDSEQRMQCVLKVSASPAQRWLPCALLTDELNQNSFYQLY